MKRIICIICAFALLLCAAPTVFAEDDRQTILNSATLSPLQTHYPPLDARVEEILGEITTAEMDTYEKVKACYTYCIEGSVYYQHIKWYDELYAIRDACGYTNINDVWMIYEASFFLEDKHGVCDDYAAAFAVLCRALGLEAYYVWGKTNTVSGGLAGHAWVNIRVGDVFYHFDPQVEANIANRNDGVISYSRFCVTDEQMEGRLFIDDRAVCVAAFGGFDCTGTTATISVSDCYGDGMTLPGDIELIFTVETEGFANGYELSLRYMGGSAEFSMEESNPCEAVLEGNTLKWVPNLDGAYRVFVVISEPNGRVSNVCFAYNFYFFDEPTEVVGDVNGDGKANALDASLVLQYDAFLLVADAEYIKNGDFNRDGNVNPLDASLILQYDALLIPAPTF